MYQIKLTDDALEDFKWFKKSEQTLILDTIEEQLSWEPAKGTKHRKSLRPNDLSKWELRIGNKRVFYDVDKDNKLIKIKAIGWKEHNTLLIKGKEFKL
ncbi:MAG TPA: plasmid stabilization protein ParE [Desulfotomaculum sp.]|nr:plasmid stabilization protein ParE [Desulfotomaculum sp.]